MLGQFGAEEAIGCRLPHDDVVTVGADPGSSSPQGGHSSTEIWPKGRWPDRPAALGGASPLGLQYMVRVDHVNGGQSTGMT